VVGVYIFFGGSIGLEQLILSIFTSLSTFILLPVILFILMGELMFHSGMGFRVLNVLDEWLGHLPGRLSLLAVGAGTLLAALTGVSMASTSILGSVLVPEMEKRGYKKPMTLGPILGSGGLAIMIPPSALAVLLGAISEISVGGILIAIIVPALLMASLYAAYIIVRCKLQPDIAPSYEVPPTPLSKKLADTVRYVLPVGLIVFLVIGVIMLGIATPSEAAASGTLGVIVTALLYRSLSWQVINKSLVETVKVSGMILLILAGARAFSQILSFTGATYGLAEVAVVLPIAPILLVISMQVVVLILGCFMDVVAIMLITLPVFVPSIKGLGFDPVWFAVLMLLNIEMAMLTPPFGIGLFVMKGVAPKDTTMVDIYRAALPFLGLDAIALCLIIVFPAIALWLPSLVR
jgi:tripartite ATP-independent transporter DctM subunit